MSKTVKRVSKTVKRVTRVMILGLVAMLGPKAEAHYLIIKGKLRYCSVCSDGAGLTGVTGDGVAELIVGTKLVAIFCSPKAEPIVVKKKLTLVDEVEVAGNGPVNFFVSDQIFADPELGFCRGAPPDQVEVQILKMSVQYNAYECFQDPSDPNPGLTCPNKVLVNTMKSKNCKLQLGALPGTEYVCDSFVVEHPL